MSQPSQAEAIVSAPQPVPISAFLITRDNARTLDRTLRSLAWVDEIVQVDSFSTDATVDIGRARGARVLQRAWPGFRDQYQFAAEQCTHDWVLYVDADEEITPELAAAMRAELARDAGRPEAERRRGFLAHRRTWFLGRWILHGGWGPATDREVRLYDRRHGRWLGDLHACVRVDGPTAVLPGLVNHYSYRDLADQLRKIDAYSTTAAADNQRNGKRFSLLKLVGEPPLRFLRDYVLYRGFLDGLPGLIIALNTMFYVFIKQAKLYERQRGLLPPADAA